MSFANLWTDEELQNQEQAPLPVPAETRVTFQTQVGPALGELKGYLAATYGGRFEEIARDYQALGDIDSEAQSKVAVSLISKAKKLEKDMEAERGLLTKPLLSFKSGIDNAFKEFTVDLGRVESDVKRKISLYQSKVEMERLKAEKAAREEAARLQAKLDEEAKEAGVEAPQVVVPVVAPPPTTTRTEEGTASTVKTWDFEVEDEAKVPRDYLCLDEKAVRRAIKGGVREIPGLKIYEKSSVRVRV